MCIRDSKKPGVAETIDWAKCLLALDVIALSPEVISDTLGAVSYTHLRAHETVLDLVCRLLLEKKKNTSQKCHHSTTINNTNTTHYQYTSTRLAQRSKQQ